MLHEIQPHDQPDMSSWRCVSYNCVRMSTVGASTDSDCMIPNAVPRKTIINPNQSNTAFKYRLDFFLWSVSFAIYNIFTSPNPSAGPTFIYDTVFPIVRLDAWMCRVAQNLFLKVSAEVPDRSNMVMCSATYSNWLQSRLWIKFAT